MRRNLMYWLLRKTGHGENEYMPMWAVVLACILFPGRIRYALAGDVYNPVSHSLKLGKHWISLYAIESLLLRKSTHWFRVVEVRDFGAEIQMGERVKE